MRVTLPCLLLSVLLLLPLSQPAADVIQLKDGTVLLGTAGVDDPTGIRISSFGRDETIPQSEILLIERTLAALSEAELEILLPDRSVLKGRIRNYDEEIGLLLETYFGAITLPPKGIQEIHDPVQRRRFSGVPFQAVAGAGVQAPIGGLAENFGASLLARAGAEWKTDLLRGLYAGVGLGWSPLDYTSSDEVGYQLFDLTGYGMYRWLGTQLSSGFFSRLIPFALLGGGLTYIHVRDDRAEALLERRNELSPVLWAALGADLRLHRLFTLRVASGVSAVFQAEPGFSFGGELGVVYTP